MSEPVKCPCCGGALIDDGRILIDSDGRNVIKGHQQVHLGTSEMVVFEALWRTRPTLIRLERLMYLTSPAGYDDDRCGNVIQAMISKMRPKLRPLGIEIANVWHEGYRIDMTVREPS